MEITTHCAHDHHDACTGCDCGCHWLMPLIRGQAQQAVGPSGRVWTLAT